jgi:release factor glutamine methyltransferase
VQLKPSLNAAIARLTAAEVPSPRLNAETLLTFMLNCDRAYLYAHPERELTPDEQTSYDRVLGERSRGVPAQYITGHQEFWGMDLIVSPAVLIPRPETEHVVETVLELLKSDLGLRPSDLGTDPQAQGQWSEVRILDVGTGSGAIALALARDLPRAEIQAVDSSSPALEIARANAARLQLDSRIQFHQADLLDGLSAERFDFIVSNPPYVGDSEEEEVQLEVRKFEPRHAVFAGPTGLEVIERLIPQAYECLRPGGWLVMEISGTIADSVKLLLCAWDDLGIVSDLQSIPRVMRARKPRLVLSSARSSAPSGRG